MTALDAGADAALLAEAIRRYAADESGLEELRATAESIIDRWQAAGDEDKPAWSDSELPLWNAVWHIFLGCNEELARDGIRIHLEYLSGRRPVATSGQLPSSRP